MIISCRMVQMTFGWGNFLVGLCLITVDFKFRFPWLIAEGKGRENGNERTQHSVASFETEGAT